MVKVFKIFLLFLWGHQIAAQVAFLPDTVQPRNLQIDQLALDLDVRFVPEEGQVKGFVKIDFEALTREVDSVWLDGVKLTYHTVKLDGLPVSYRVFDKGIAVFPDSVLILRHKYRLEISYTAQPKRGLFFVGWDDPTNRAPKQIWTQGQGIDHRHWIPHVDAQNDKLRTAITATFDTGYAVISNGLLKHYIEVDGMGVWHYAMDKPHASYLIMLAIGKYNKFADSSATGVPLTNYYYPKWADRNEHTYYQSTAIFDLLEKEIGVPFPWEKYAQVPVMNFQHGAMENTEATIFGDIFCVDAVSFNDRNYVGVNAHELAHQWFGNLVTATHSTHHWLHEGFATYYAWWAENEFFGKNRLQQLRLESLNRIVAAEAANHFPLGHTQAGSERFYDKGAWVLHMLRNAVGDSAWRKAIASYLEQYQFDLVQTDFLRQKMEWASGKDLSWFFEQWVEKPGIPDLKMTISRSKSTVNVVFSQTFIQGQKPFLLQIPIKIVTTFGTRDTVLNLADQTANIRFELTKKEELLGVFPDPNFDLLATWKFEIPTEQRTFMAFHPEYLAPFVAAGFVQNVEYNFDKSIKIEEAAWLNQYTFASALGKKVNGKIGLSEAEIDFLKNTTDINLAKAYLQESTYQPEDIWPILDKWLEWQSYDLIEMALIRLCINNKPDTQKYLQKTQNIAGTSGNNVRITWLLLHSAFVSTAHIGDLTDFMSPAYDFLTRINAMNAASQLRYVNYKVADNVFNTLFQNNRRLRGAGKNFILNQSKNPELKAVFQKWLNRNQHVLSAAELEIIERSTGMVAE